MLIGGPLALEGKYHRMTNLFHRTLFESISTGGGLATKGTICREDAKNTLRNYPMVLRPAARTGSDG